MSRQDLYRCQAEAIRETDMALLVRLDDGEERWVPKSLIQDDSEVFELDQSGELVVPEWFAVKEGWE